MSKTAYNELDYTSAVARLRALEIRLLGKTDYEKLITAGSVEEAMDILANSGWKASDDYQDMLSGELAGVFSLIERLGGGLFLKTQRLKYDYLNLKALIKSELTGQSPDGLLTEFGSIPVSELQNAVLNRDYKMLPKNMKTAISEAYEQFSRIADAQLVDIIFDGAFFKDLLEYSKDIPDKKISSLIKLQIDMHNIKTFVRVRKMGKTHGFIERVVMDGGSLEREFYIERINSHPGDDAAVFEKTSFARVFQVRGDIETGLDNLFMEKVRAARPGAFGLAPLAAYFLMKENEIRNVRIILICKKAGIDEDIIRTRLRAV